MSYHPLLAFSAGAAIAIQASLNARLGMLLKSASLGAAIAFLFACIFTVLFVFLSTKQSLQLVEIKSVPIYLWFTGGAISAFGVGVFYFLIPRMGVGSMMSYALSGQILVAVIASHFGWFEQPVTPINIRIVAGLIAMILGISLINGRPGYAL